MNLLLLLFVIPFSTIIFSIVLQRLIKCPILVALTAFSVFLILAVTVFDETFFVLAVIYAVLAYVSAVLSKIIKKIINRYVVNMDNSDTNYISDNDPTDANAGCGCSRSEIIVDKNYGNKRFWR